MVSREELRSGALRAYERGRLRMAGRAAVYLVPLVALSALVSSEPPACACLGALLIGVAILLRWRNRRGAESVATGLFAGSAPLVVGLVAGRLAPGACAAAPWLSACTVLALVVGGAAGLWVGARTAAGRAGLAAAVAAAAVAALTASLGCVGLGVGAVLGAALGLVGGSVTGRLATRTVA
jgi:hypothetical protein